MDAQTNLLWHGWRVQGKIYISRERERAWENWKLFLLGTWTLKIATKQEFELLKILYMCNSNLTLIGNMSEIQLRKWWFLKTPTKPKFFMCDIGADDIMVIFCGHFSNHCYIRYVLSKSFPQITDVQLHKKTNQRQALYKKQGDLPSQWVLLLKELDRKTSISCWNFRSSLRIRKGCHGVSSCHLFEGPRRVIMRVWW